MAELEDQIRAWADEVAASSGSPVHPDEVMGPEVDGPEETRKAREATELCEQQDLPSLTLRRRVVAIAVAALIFLGAIGALALSRSGDQRITADGPTNPPSTRPATGPTETERSREPVAVSEVLGMGERGSNPMGTLRSASTPSELANAWVAAGLDGPPPDVDFAEKVVVSITIPDDACPSVLAGFSRDASTLEPIFFNGQKFGGCAQPLIPWTHLVTLDWGSTGDSFRLFLPGQSTYDFADQVLEVKRPTP